MLKLRVGEFPCVMVYRFTETEKVPLMITRSFLRPRICTLLA
jgi:hypothetical protein